jgi:uncharacterized membrane protein YphA (DoxX/SURF4 family)
MSGTTTVFHWLTLLMLCAAYLQGGLVKVLNFAGAQAEMVHFGLPASFAVAVVALELGASGLILSGVGRWLGAVALAGFTLLASLIALRFWELPPGSERFMATNAFFEHISLVGGFLFVAWHDIASRK